MKGQLRRAWKAALLGGFFIAALLLMTGTAGAYSVYVVNESGQGDADVWVSVSYLFGAKEKWNARIPNGQSHTFETGALCSALLSGAIGTSNGWYTMPHMGCAGLREGTDAGGTCCFDVKFKIQQGSDGAYHFIKY